MMLWNILFSALFILWMFAVLLFLWQLAIRNERRQSKLQDAFVTAVQQSTDAAQKAAQAAELLATYLERKP